MKVTSISSASTVQSLTAALDRQFCAYHIQLDRKDIFRKQFITPSIWLPVEKWCHVPGDLCLQSWINTTTGFWLFLGKQPERCAGVFSLFFSLPLILQLLFRVTGGEAKGMAGCSDIAQAVMVPEGSPCGFSTDFGVVLHV